MHVLSLILLLVLHQTFSLPLQQIKENPENGDYFEGDIRNRELQNGISKGVAILDGDKWPGGIVYYEISDEYDDEDIEIIINGMRMVEEQTRNCVKFVERTNEQNYTTIVNGGGCSSYVGMIGGAQPVSLKKPTAISPGTCVTTGITAHEFLHALGFFHEQSRPDRDEYIKVLFENIQSGLEYNFNKYTTDYVDTLGLPYDVRSIMHYSPYSFSKNGEPTIISLEEGVTLGQRLKLSEIDVAEVRRYYGCE